MRGVIEETRGELNRALNHVRELDGHVNRKEADAAWTHVRGAVEAITNVLVVMQMHVSVLEGKEQERTQREHEREAREEQRNA